MTDKLPSSRHAAPDRAPSEGRGNLARPEVSFEFFPPKTEKGFASLFRTVEELKPLGPDFVSVTWGAGGSTRR